MNFIIAREGYLKSIFGDWQSTHKRGCKAFQPFTCVDRPRINSGFSDLAFRGSAQADGFLKISVTDDYFNRG
jgi:hypothetical protein